LLAGFYRGWKAAPTGEKGQLHPKAFLLNAYPVSSIEHPVVLWG
jgi:hypothetical protein